MLSPEEGEMVSFGGLGVRFMIGGAETGASFALVEHPMEPRILAAPMHTHQHEDEHTYVLESEVSVQVGEDARVARPGDLVFKPKGVPHAFWNTSDVLARALQIISPAGFERYFAEIAALVPPAREGPPNEQALGAVMARYGLSIWARVLSSCSWSATDWCPAKLPCLRGDVSQRSGESRLRES
jgi:quercetin dioxygenase-like cupin family protein